jgi:hypothetical protein
MKSEARHDWLLRLKHNKKIIIDITKTSKWKNVHLKKWKKFQLGLTAPPTWNDL